MPNNHFQITSLKVPAQLKEASLMIKQCWQETYRGILPASQLAQLDESIWQRSLTRPGRHNFVAVIDDKIVGLVSYGTPREKDAFADGWGELMSIYVLADYQGEGLGTTLMQTAMRHLKTAGFRHAALWVLSANQSAIQFYEKNGWHTTGVERQQTVLNREVTLVQYERKL